LSDSLSLFHTPAPPTLADVGWDDEWAAVFAALAPPGALAARVARADRGACTVLAPGNLRVTSGRRPVATGDWVIVGPGPLPDDLPTVIDVLPRRSAFVRERPGRETAEQVVAANVDTVLVVNGLDTGVNARRIERYLALAWQSGAVPAIVLTKADCCTDDDVAGAVEDVRSVALGVEVHTVSAADGRGIDRLATAHLSQGRTVALLGPSGSGKSTLVNRLAGADVMATGETRRDGKGRHTTVHRELVVLPGRGLLLDTPGMRGISLWDAAEGVSQTFADVEALIGECRFSDCRHLGEPGCAVLAAVEDGSLVESRLASWHKLQREARALAARQGDRAAKEENLRRWKAIAKASRHRDRRRDR
jgi:ribosome biogenesis GTPase / thiamine phosphate phosphatase